MTELENLHTEINEIYEKPKKISYFDFAHALTGYTLYNKQDGKQVNKWEIFDAKNPTCAEAITPTILKITPLPQSSPACKIPK